MPASPDTFLISLPHPRGGLTIFRCWPATVLAPALAARYPDIRTYAGYAAADSRVRLRLERTPRGLSAGVSSPAGDYLIEPGADGDPGGLRVSFRRDHPAGPRPACAAEPAALPEFRGDPALPAALGDTLRTYRLAVAATGEFTQSQGGTVEEALAAIATIVNRVNGIYERDLALRLVLADDNDRLIFTDPAADPYGTNARTQNQAVIDDILGAGNYDIGHLFHLESYGLAEVGSACVEGQKARALSGLGPEMPLDRYAVDLVAHEIGHQLGATHTFNQCGVRQGERPVEPGSGSTVMGWPGLCGADNLQDRSDDYFHTVSIAEIARYTTLAAGRTCATRTPTGNRPPRVDAGAGGWTLPRDTPFELSGAASDPDGDTLTFSWEQTDEGPRTPAAQPRGAAPLFRSWPPAADSVRSFPRLDELLQGTTPFGETLPGYARPLTFRLTVRDGRGGVAWDSLLLSVADQAGPFRVLTQNAPVSWQAGTLVGVEWDVAGADRPPVNAAAVDIFLSADGGRSFPVRLAAGVPNTGQASVRLPDTLSGDRFRIKVKAADNVFFDLNDADFSIRPGATAAPSAGGPLTGLALFPNPAGSSLFLRIDLREAAFLTAEISSLPGQSLRRYPLGRLPEGRSETRLDIAGLPAGVYLLRMRDDKGRLGHGVLLVRVE